jgi:hypothetical protein
MVKETTEDGQASNETGALPLLGHLIIDAFSLVDRSLDCVVCAGLGSDNRHLVPQVSLEFILLSLIEFAIIISVALRGVSSSAWISRFVYPSPGVVWALGKAGMFWCFTFSVLAVSCMGVAPTVPCQ